MQLKYELIEFINFMGKHTFMFNLCMIERIRK